MLTDLLAQHNFSVVLLVRLTQLVRTTTTRLAEEIDKALRHLYMDENIAKPAGAVAVTQSNERQK